MVKKCPLWFKTLDGLKASARLVPWVQVLRLVVKLSGPLWPMFLIYF